MVPVKKLQEAGLGAGGSLGTQKAHGTDQVIQVIQIQLKLHHPQGGALTNRGWLGRLEVGKRKGGKVLVCFSETGQLRQYVDQFLPHQLQGLGHDDNVRIISHVTGGGPQMDNSLCLRALYAVSIDMAHNIMADFLLPGLSHIIIDFL